MTTSSRARIAPAGLASTITWLAVAVGGAGALARLALGRGEQVSAAWLLVAALCTYAISRSL